jgi:hypothetical protein
MARARDVLLRMRGEGGDARRAVRETREELRQLARTEARARITVQAQGVEAQIERVRQRLDRLREQGERGIDVRVQTGRATAQLERLEARLAQMSAREVEIDVDVRRGALERTGSGLGFLTRRVEGVTRGISDFVRAIPIAGRLIGAALEGAVNIAASLGQAVTSALTTMIESGGVMARVFGAGASGAASSGAAFAGLGSAAATAGGAVIALSVALAGLLVVIGGVVIAIQAIIGAIVALSAALVAVVASLAAAAAGLGALGVAFLATLGPAILGVILLMSRLKAIMETRQAREAALKQSVQEAAAAEQARTTAMEASEEAQRSLAETTVQARQEMARAAEELQDAERGIGTARIDLRQSRLDLRNARAELREFLRAANVAGPALNALTRKFEGIAFDPSQAGRELGARGEGVSGDRQRELEQLIINVQRAQQGVLDATDAVGDSETRLAEARRRSNEFTRRGLRAYGPYREALRRVATAERDLVEATERKSAATQEYERQLQKLSTTERGTLARVSTMVREFGKLAKAFSEPILGAFNQVFDRLRDARLFEGLEAGLRRLGQEFAGVVRSIGTFLTEPATARAFKVMADGAASLTRNLGSRAFVDVLRIVRNLAEAAMPLLEAAARRVAVFFGRIADRTGDIEGTRGTISNLVGHFREWAALGWSVLRAVGAIFRAAAPGGRSLAASLRRIVDRFNEWANNFSGRLAIRIWFESMIERAKDVVRWLRRGITAIEELGEALGPTTEVFRAFAKIVSGIYHSIKLAVRLIPRLADPLGLGKGLKGGGLATALRGLFAGGARGFMGIVRHAGGPIPGAGEVPVLARGGEYMVREAVASRVGRAGMDAFNRGMMQLVPAGGPITDNSRRTEVHAHFNVPGGGPADMRTAAALLDRELWKAGG